MKQALIIGKSGQVARFLAKALSNKSVPYLCTSSKEGASEGFIDLSRPDSIRDFFTDYRKKFPQPVEVFLPGAMTHVDRCEQERELCRKTNYQGPVEVAKLCREYQWPLTFFSTEYVYGESEYHGGQVGPFRESDSPSASSWYGQCKLDAESEILRIHPQSLVVRTTMVFSWDPTGMNFLMQYLRHFEKLLAGEVVPKFKIPVDQISTPTYAPDLSLKTVQLREANQWGIFHLVGKDLLSRKHLLEMVCREFGFSADLLPKGFDFLTTAELGQAARRPLTAGLTSEKIASLGLVPLSLGEAFAQVKLLQKSH